MTALEKIQTYFDEPDNRPKDQKECDTMLKDLINLLIVEISECANKEILL